VFRIDQIITASQFIRYFREIAGHLSESSEPLLITKKNGEFLVVMNGDFFEGLLLAHSKAETLQDSSNATPAPKISDFKS
jgi:hypothetical protein